jgi:hypothetical protein
MTQLSPHFTLEEMIASQEAARKGIDNTPTSEIVEHLRETCAQLETVRGILGDRPISISSGYRCPKLNEAIGGAKDSAHMSGYAVDFICPSFGGPLTVCQAIAASGIVYDQLIHEYGNWTHISFDPRKRREALTIFHDGKGYQLGLLAPPDTGTRLA